MTSKQIKSSHSQLFNGWKSRINHHTFVAGNGTYFLGSRESAAHCDERNDRSVMAPDRYFRVSFAIDSLNVFEVLHSAPSKSITGLF